MVTGSVIVVTHNSEAHIARCLRGVKDQPGWDRIVVDNCSTDDTVEVARACDPGAHLIVNNQNCGFGAAANQGARVASGEVLLFLNPDAIAQPRALDRLAEGLRAEGVGAAGGALLGPSGLTEVGFVVRRFPTLGRALAEVLALNHVWPGNPLNRSYRCLDLDYARLQDVEQPAGACLAVRREAWEGVNGFDDRFFPVWFEDVDFCRRLRASGWKIEYCPEAVFVHSGGHSVNHMPFRDRELIWYRNLIRYFRKHHSHLAVAVLRVGIALGVGIRSAATLLGGGPKGVNALGALGAYGAVFWRQVIKGESEVLRQ